MIYSDFPETKGKRALVLVSGGMDSRVCLQKAVKDLGAKHVIAACTFYGQKHDKEIEYADMAARKLGVECHVVNMSSVFDFNKDCSALLQGSKLDIELNSYEEQMKERHDKGKPMIPNALVPFRNGLFLSYATALALQFKCDYVLYGAHASDAHIELTDENGNTYEATPYPDCTSAFIEAMSDAIYLGTGGVTRLVAQYGIELGMTKDDFKETWSCYCGGDNRECGICGTCREKIDSLRVIGFTDMELLQKFKEI